MDADANALDVVTGDSDPTAVTADSLAPTTADMAETADARTYKLTDEAKVTALLAAIDGGLGVREAAAEIGVNVRTAYGILARSDDQLDTVRSAIRKLMIGQTLDRMRDWEVASEVGARKRGNHAPARDWLLHAGVIDPLAGDAGVSVRVAICIGTPEQPMTVTSPQLLDVEGVTE